MSAEGAETSCGDVCSRQCARPERREEDLTNTFHRRPLPPQLVPFAAPQGKALFASALTAGCMETYFVLASNYVTQAEPAYCGLSCLVMVLNSLGVDPKRTWKGPWRWYSEEMLDCCAPLERVKAKGITLAEFVCLAQCNGLSVRAHRGDKSSLAAFRDAVLMACTSSDQVLAVSYSRRVLQQTGDGHFSPIGGFDPQSDMVLVLDVARFKYPAHWVPLELMWQAMVPPDKETGLSRGYFELRRNAALSDVVSKFRITLDVASWSSRLRTTASFTTTTTAAAAAVHDQPVITFRSTNSTTPSTPDEQELLDELQRHPLMDDQKLTSLAVLFFLALPPPLRSPTAPPSMYDAPVSKALSEEITWLRHQITSLCSLSGMDHAASVAVN